MSAICTGLLWTCPNWSKVNKKIGNDTRNTLTDSVNRTVTMQLGSLELILQSRSRIFNYTDKDIWSTTNAKAVADSGTYVVCADTGSSEFSCTFSDVLTTLDTEVCYLDVRNDVIVTKEITDIMTATDNFRQAAPTESVSVFTGYESTNFHPVMFGTIPIEQTVVYNLYIKGIKTELHKEQIHRGSDNVFLLMESFPSSAFGITINTAWAKDVDWYRSDLNVDLDGDRLLFWPPWLRQCGQLNQSLDEFNRDLIKQYDIDQKDINNTVGKNPGINQTKIFLGSVAFDKDKNIFYSLAIPETVMSTDSEYILKQSLICAGVATKIPTDSESNVCYPIAPL